MRKKEDHRQRRRYLSHAFSLSHLVKVEPVIQDKVQTLKEIIDNSTGQSMNVLQWFRMLALDIISIDYHKGVGQIGALSFGGSFDSLKSGQPPAYLHDLDNIFLLEGINSNYPLIGKLLRS
jgi:hypothetical protein